MSDFLFLCGFIIVVSVIEYVFKSLLIKNNRKREAFVFDWFCYFSLLTYFLYFIFKYIFNIINCIKKVL